MEKLFSVNELKKTKVQKKYFKTSKGAMITSLGMAVTFLFLQLHFLSMVLESKIPFLFEMLQHLIMVKRTYSLFGLY